MHAIPDPQPETQYERLPYTPLSDQEITRLTHKAQGGCAASRELLIVNNRRLVVTIARGYQGNGLDMSDLISEGTIGLIVSLSKYDPTQAKLSTYATWWIRQRILRALSNQSKTIRIPVHMTEKIASLRRATASIAQEIGREPTNDELMERTGLSEATIKLCYDASLKTISLNTHVYADEDQELGENISDESDTPSMACTKADDLECLKDALGVLDTRETEIITSRFGLDGREPQTLESIGVKYNVTRERIRQIEGIALAKVRRHIREQYRINHKMIHFPADLPIEEDEAQLAQVG